MTTQLQNQDPFSPMENGDFIAQMAQFSTVTGIAEMGESLKSLSNQLGEFRIATATNLLGHSVLVPGNKVKFFISFVGNNYCPFSLLRYTIII